MAKTSKEAAQSFRILKGDFNASASDFLSKSFIFITVIKQIANAIKSMINAYSSFETLKTSLEIVTGSVERAGLLFEKFKNMARITPFSVEDLTAAGTQLMQIGVELTDIEKTLRMLGDASGGDKDIFRRIVTNYTQIMSAGKSTAMDTRQFAYMGLPIYKVLKDMGVEGTATARDITKAFEIMTSKGGAFFDGMNKHAKTLKGTLNTIKEEWTELQAVIMTETGFGENITKGLTEVKRTLNNFTVALEKLKEWKNIELFGADKIGKFLFGDNAAKTLTLKLIKEIGKLPSALNDWTERENRSNRAHYIMANINTEEFASPYQKYEAMTKEVLPQIYEEIAREREELAKLDAEIEKYGKLKEKHPMWRPYEQSYDKAVRKREELLRWGFSEDNIFNVKAFAENIRDAAKVEIDKQEREKEYKEGLEALRKQIKNDYGETNQAEIEALREQIKYWRDVKSGQYAKDLTPEEEREIDIIIAELLKKLESALGGGKSKGGNSVIKKAQQETLHWWEQLKEDVYKGIIEYTALAKKNKNNEEMTEEERKKWSYYTTPDANGKTGGQELIKQTVMYAGFSTLGEATSGTDAGTFFQTYAKTGNWILAIIETVIGAIVKVLMSIEGFEEMLNGVTEFISRFKPILKPLIEYLSYLTDSTYAVFNIIDILATMLSPLFKVLSKVMQLIALPARALGLLFTALLESMKEGYQKLNDWIDSIFEWLDLGMEKQSQEEEELERLKELNEALSSLTQAIKDQEEYYLKKKMEINADTYKDKVLNVNDMILTPQGKFSTHPDDYLIATKNPYSLGGGNVVMNVNVTNNASDVVDASVEQRESANGTKELVLMISRKVANDYATGSNGWDSAYNSRVSRMNGRRLTT
jgi:hypothetical protein